MTETVSLFQFFNPVRLTGALFEKELRVASRRVRSYGLRSGYVLLLCLLILSAWYSILGISARNMAAFGASRTSVASTYVAMHTLWFQLVAAQLIAAVMVSLSMTDEARRGTVGVLMTTPVTSVQIVLGKLLGGLLQVGILLAVSLPILTLLRVQGGFSWESVIAGFCISLSAAVLAGSLSLLLSTCCRQAHQVISTGALVYFIVFLVAPALASLLIPAGTAGAKIRFCLNLINPFHVMYAVVPRTLGIRTVVPGGLAWLIHCLILMVVSIVLLGVSARRIRRTPGRTARPTIHPSIKRVHGSPVAWKERRGPSWYRRWNDIVLSVLGVGTAGLMCLTPGFAVAPTGAYLYYLAGAFWLVTFLRLAISAAGGITREKESGAWPILLTTPLEDRQIMRAKAFAALRRNALLVLAAFVIEIVFLLSTRSPTAAYVPLGLLPKLTFIFFVLACGLYFGTRLKTTATAVVATIGMYLFLAYFVSRLLGSFLFQMLLNPTSLRELVLWSFLLSLPVLALAIVLGVFFLRRARWNMRRYVF